MTDITPSSGVTIADVSVIIPCFNAEAFVGVAIESALAQGPDQVEVIVVDDGSTDASLAAIQAYGDRIKIHTGPNRGVCAARNQGLAMATGAWIKFLDADDMLHPRTLEIQTAAIAALPETPFIHATRFHVPIEHRLSDFPHLEVAAEAATAIRSEGFLSANYLPAAGLFRRSYLDEVGGWDEELRRWTDLEYHARLVAPRRPFLALETPLYAYRQHDGPRISSANTSFKGLNNGRLALERTRAALEPVWPDRDELARYLAPFYLNLARAAAANGDLEQFRELLTEADRLRGETGFHLKCVVARACASVVGPRATSHLMERALRAS